WTWPLDLSRPKASWELPFKGRRLARITRVDPVNVPSRFENIVHAKPEILPGLEACHVGDQLKPRVLCRCAVSPSENAQDEQRSNRELTDCSQRQLRSEEQAYFNCFAILARGISRGDKHGIHL